MITKGAFLKYTLLPGFIPRIIELATSGFGHIAFLIATIYQAVRLLPPDHPYLDPRNIGRFGIRHVLGAAYGNLEFSKKNFDQVLIYFTILIGMILLLGQFILLVVALIAQQPAMAQIVPAWDIMLTSSIYNRGPEQDLVFILMDRIFGVKNIFNSCISTGAACLDMNGNPLPIPPAYPEPFHLALHTMLRFYSLGIFIVSIIIILYFVIRLTAETAATGSPFGERANMTWLPVRFIIFCALLVPLNIGGVNGGLNAGQLITLWTAKFGSNFASNGWNRFNITISEATEDTYTYLGEPRNLIAVPNAPELGDLLKFMFVVKTCKIAEEWVYGHDPDGVQAYIVRDKLSGVSMAGQDWQELMTTDFATARKFANYGNIAIRFGVKGDSDDPGFLGYKGAVVPVCGEIKFTVLSANANGAAVANTATAIQEFYFRMLKDMWRDTTIIKRAECIVRDKLQPANDRACNQIPDNEFANNLVQTYQTRLNNWLRDDLPAKVEEEDWSVPDLLKDKGWGGAAIWYNRVAQLNGEVSSSILGLPQPSAYPIIMETIAQQRSGAQENVNASTIFDPELSGGKEPKYPRDQVRDKQIAVPMYSAYRFWQEGGLYASQEKDGTGNLVIDAINAIIGTHGIFEMRKNTDIHPLAQLSTIGRSMMEASLRNIGVGTIGEATGLLFSPSARRVADLAGRLMTSVGVSFIAMSFILFYVLPFMPFIYFFFAIGSWVKAIFEAIVAMPLWALAHIVKVDGEGIPGSSASAGYFMLLEIFLRPILIVFGLICSIGIFSAMVVVLNQTFDLVIANLTGFDQSTDAAAGTADSLIDFARSTIDEFFFTVLYVVICYMIGLSSFKMIDAIPDKIMRWIESVDTFSDGEKDPGGELLSKSYKGTQILTSQAKGGALAALAMR